MKKLILIALFFLPFTASAVAVSVDVVSTKAAGSGTSATWAHDATGSNLLMVQLSLRKNPTSATGVTCAYNGDAMTVDPNITDKNDGNDARMYVFSLANPDTGSNNIVCSWTNTNNNLGAGISFNNADNGVGTSVVLADGSCNPKTYVTLTGLTTNDGALGTYINADQAGGITWSSPIDSQWTLLFAGVQLSANGGTIIGSTTPTFNGSAYANNCNVIAGTPILGATIVPPVVPASDQLIIFGLLQILNKQEIFVV